MEEITIECPCCKATVVVDIKTGSVIHSKKFQEPNQSLEDFLKNEKTRDDDLAKKFAEAKKKEDSKLELLNKKFEWAKKNEDKLPEVKRPIDWD